MGDGDEGASISSPGRDGPRRDSPWLASGAFTGCGKVGGTVLGEIACDTTNLDVEEQQLEFLGAGRLLPHMWVI